ncbi:MAG: hypothetical protein K2P59_14125 [Acetatifactor sp.]|nr:hypothetical protein [Acetatifactor sp.]
MRIFKKTMIFFCMTTLLICPQPITVHASVQNTVTEYQAEAEAFVRDCYETLTEETLALLPERTDSSIDSVDLHKYLAHYKAVFECGLQGYDNIATTVYSLSDENYQVVLVQYDALFEGIDAALPGFSTELVHRQDDGQWKLFAPDSSIPLQLSDEITQIMASSEEFISITNEVSLKFESTIQNDPDIVLRLSDLSNKIIALTAQYLQDDSDSFLNTPTQKDSSEKKIPDTYTVQKGDCLWHIAEDLFGDGMHWIELYENNKESIGDNPDLILSGLLLRLY